MIKRLKDIELNYIDYGQKKGDTVVLLHGWGQNISLMKELGDSLKSDYRILIIDLPGHGESSEPDYAWELSEFVDLMKELFAELKIENPILVGHSFGGKISLMYASMYKVKKLVVFASPYKQKIKNLSLKVKMLKFLKTVPVINKLEGFAKKHIGSTDYKNASEVMRQILVNHVNTDITDLVIKIKAPTLILWGDRDEEVPIEDAYDLENLISDSGVVKYDGCTHYAYIERLGQTINILKNFFGGK